MYSQNNLGGAANSQSPYLTQSARVSAAFSKPWGVIGSEERSYSVATKTVSSSPTTFSIPAVTTEHEFGRFSLFPGSPNVPAGQAPTFFSNTVPRDYGGLASSPSFSTSFLRNHLGQVPQHVGALQVATTWNVGLLGKIGSTDAGQVQKMQSSPGFSSTWPRVNRGGAGDQTAAIAYLRHQVKELTAQLHARRAKARAKASAQEVVDEDQGAKNNQNANGNTALGVRIQVDEEGGCEQSSSSTPMSPVSASLATKIGDLKRKIVNGLIVSPSQADAELAGSDSDLAEQGFCSNCQQASSEEVSLVGDDDAAVDAFPGFRTSTTSETEEDTQDQELPVDVVDASQRTAVENASQPCLEDIEAAATLPCEADALKSIELDHAVGTNLDASEAFGYFCTQEHASDTVGLDKTTTGDLDGSSLVDTLNEAESGSVEADTSDQLNEGLGNEEYLDAEKTVSCRRKVSIEHPPNWRIEGWGSKKEHESDTSSDGEGNGIAGSEGEDHSTGDAEHEEGIQSTAEGSLCTEIGEGRLITRIESVDGITETKSLKTNVINSSQQPTQIDDRNDASDVQNALKDGERREEEEAHQDEIPESDIDDDESPVLLLENGAVVESSTSVDADDNPPLCDDPSQCNDGDAQSLTETQDNYSPEDGCSESNEGDVLSAAGDGFAEEVLEPRGTDDSSESVYQEDPLFDDASEAGSMGCTQQETTGGIEEDAVDMNAVLRVEETQEDFDAGSIYSSEAYDDQPPVSSDDGVPMDEDNASEAPSQDDPDLNVTGNLHDSRHIVQTASDLEENEWSSQDSTETEMEEDGSDAVSKRSVNERVPMLDEPPLYANPSDEEEFDTQQAPECEESPDSLWEGSLGAGEAEDHSGRDFDSNIFEGSVVEVGFVGEPQESVFRSGTREADEEMDREESEASLGVTLANGMGCAEDSGSESSVDMDQVDGVVSRELSMRMAKGMQLASFPINHESDILDISG